MATYRNELVTPHALKYTFLSTRPRCSPKSPKFHPLFHWRANSQYRPPSHGRLLYPRLFLRCCRVGKPTYGRMAVCLSLKPAGPHTTSSLLVVPGTHFRRTSIKAVTRTDSLHVSLQLILVYFHVIKGLFAREPDLRKSVQHG